MIRYPIQNTRKFVMKFLNSLNFFSQYHHKISRIPTQSNEYDCEIFVCKYMERAILRKKMDWTSFKDWQKYMPKFRAEFGYALCLTIKM
ncbi:hypothetical protein IEQ34_019995 [Dendrobium chrysotoxum]|uniref:Ubiquitin-like protease family profile domain-containing protein n=1 Tax=Dendrobium chrysotoxum TaxID=161865 RepID=A0AAV7G8H4_DENCH|nr:hypothetical protein IEQ34_019995 [Dendrobium chrysotoxum]